MIARLLELSAPRPADAEPIRLRAVVMRPGFPQLLLPSFADAIDLFWMMPPVVEGPAPMPSRDFTNTARIFVEATALGRS